MKKMLAFGLALLMAPALWAQPPVDVRPQWKVKDGNPLLINAPAGWLGGVTSVAFSPDGQTLAAAGEDFVVGHEGIVILRDARTGAPKGQLTGHKNGVVRLAWSPDGKTLASQSQDDAIFLWDIATLSARKRINEGRERPMMRAEGDMVQQMLKLRKIPRLVLGGWSPDSKMFFTYENRWDDAAQPPARFTTFQLWDAQSAQAIRSFVPRGIPLNKVTWSADGKAIVVLATNSAKAQGAGTQIDFYDAQTGRLARTVAQSEQYQYVLAFDTETKRALLRRITPAAEKPANGDLVLWDLQEDREVWTVRATSRMGRFSLDGRKCLTSNDEGEIAIRDAADGKVVQTLPASGITEVVDMALAPDNQRLASAERGMPTVRLWKLNAPIPQPRYVAETAFQEVSNLRALSWTGDTLIAVTEQGSYANELRVGRDLQKHVWNSATRSVESKKVEEKRLLSTGSIAPDAKFLAIEVGRQPKPVFYEPVGIALYDLRDLTLIRTTPDELKASDPQWSPDGKSVAFKTSKATLVLWDAVTGEMREIAGSKVEQIAWSPGGNFIVGSTLEGIEIFDAASGMRAAGWKVNGRVRELSFSPDGKTLAVGVMARPGLLEMNAASVQLFNPTTGALTRSLQTQPIIRRVRWTPDGTGIAASSYADQNRHINADLQIWDASTGTERHKLGDSSSLDDFVFSPDGKRVATESGNRVRVWELK